jgi:hypothetical protein
MPPQWFGGWIWWSTLTAISVEASSVVPLERADWSTGIGPSWWAKLVYNVFMVYSFQWGLQNNYKQLILALFWSCLKHQDPCGDPSVASLEECFDWWAFAIVLDIHPREDLMCLMWQDMTRDENVCVAWGLCPNCWVSNISRWGYGQHWSMVPGDHEVWWRVGVVGPTNTVCILCIQCVYPNSQSMVSKCFQWFPKGKVFILFWVPVIGDLREIHGCFASLPPPPMIGRIFPCGKWSNPCVSRASFFDGTTVPSMFLCHSISSQGKHLHIPKMDGSIPKNMTRSSANHITDL